MTFIRPVWAEYERSGCANLKIVSSRSARATSGCREVFTMIDQATSSRPNRDRNAQQEECVAVNMPMNESCANEAAGDDDGAKLSPSKMPVVFRVRFLACYTAGKSLLVSIRRGSVDLLWHLNIVRACELHDDRKQCRRSRAKAALWTQRYHDHRCACNVTCMMM
jgi:hypothetical protein